MLRTRLADAHHHFFPGSFAGMHSGKAMLDERAFAGRSACSSAVKFCDGNSAWVTSTRLELHFTRAAHQRKILFAARMPVAMIML